MEKKGFTFVELLWSVLILAGAIGGALLLYTSSMISSRQAWDTTVATSHGEYVLEEMQTQKSLEHIVSIDWNQWVKLQGLATLPKESIDVQFKDPNKDPLDIRVAVHWERKARENHIILKTKMTK